MKDSEINPFDLLSGKVVKTAEGNTYWFKSAGNNMHSTGEPKFENLHRVDGPAIITGAGAEAWYVDGNLHRVDGPAITWTGHGEWWYGGAPYTAEEHAEKVKCLQQK